MEKILEFPIRAYYVNYYPGDGEIIVYQVNIVGKDEQGYSFKILKLMWMNHPRMFFLPTDSQRISLGGKLFFDLLSVSKYVKKCFLTMEKRWLKEMEELEYKITELVLSLNFNQQTLNYLRDRIKKLNQVESPSLEKLYEKL